MSPDALAALLVDVPGAPQADHRELGGGPAAVNAAAVDAALWHGVAPLLYHVMGRRGLLDTMDPSTREALRMAALEAVVVEELRDAHLRRTLDAFRDAGLEPIVFKGGAVAVTHYPQPWMRPRGDTDLLVRPADRVRAEAVLQNLGFTRMPRPEGEGIVHQARYSARHAAMTLAYDLHWRLTEPLAFAHVLSYDEILGHARVLDRGWRVPSDAHALFIGCVHRAAHHYGADQLALHYDLHLIAGALDDTGWHQFAALAKQRDVRAVCLSALQRAQALFGTRIPAAVLEALAAAGAPEATAIYVNSSLRRIDILREDLHAASSWPVRVQLLKEHLFPNAAYMRARYRVAGPWVWPLLPALYAVRAGAGAVRWMRPLRDSQPAPVTTRP